MLLCSSTTTPSNPRLSITHRCLYTRDKRPLLKITPLLLDPSFWPACTTASCAAYIFSQMASAGNCSHNLVPQWGLWDLLPRGEQHRGSFKLTYSHIQERSEPENQQNITQSTPPVAVTLDLNTWTAQSALTSTEILFTHRKNSTPNISYLRLVHEKLDYLKISSS